MTWRNDAACAGMGIPHFTQIEGDRAGQIEAVRVCRRCPVADDCLRWAADHDAPGVWGGTTEQPRHEWKAGRITAEQARDRSTPTVPAPAPAREDPETERLRALHECLDRLDEFCAAHDVDQDELTGNVQTRRLTGLRDLFCVLEHGRGTPVAVIGATVGRSRRTVHAAVRRYEQDAA